MANKYIPLVAQHNILRNPTKRCAFSSPLLTVLHTIVRVHCRQRQRCGEGVNALVVSIPVTLFRHRHLCNTAELDRLDTRRYVLETRSGFLYQVFDIQEISELLKHTRYLSCCLFRCVSIKAFHQVQARMSCCNHLGNKKGYTVVDSLARSTAYWVPGVIR